MAKNSGNQFTFPRTLAGWWVDPKGAREADEQEHAKEAEEGEGVGDTGGKGLPSLDVAFEWACQGRITPHVSGDRGYDVFSVFVTQLDCRSYRGSSRRGFCLALRRAYQQFLDECQP